ncbi:hypothetical protein DRQ33_00590 [bacterium]|nr:MAG: hypothetical protein DRQ33_00590 [bacterium]
MRYIIFGAGLFGKSIAKRLVELGAEVHIVDRQEEALESIKDYVAGAIIAESTEREAIVEIVNKINPDEAIICFGESFDVSLLLTVYLHELGVKHIIARASNPMQGEILRRLGVNYVILPEIITAERMGEYLILGENDLLTLDNEHTIARIKVPPKITGKTVAELNTKKYGIKILFIHREYMENELFKLIQPENNIELTENDNLILLGHPNKLARFVKQVQS